MILKGTLDVVLYLPRLFFPLHGRELDKLCKKRDLLNTEKEKSDGRREVLNETIKSLQNELNQKIYKYVSEVVLLLLLLLLL